MELETLQFDKTNVSNCSTCSEMKHLIIIIDQRIKTYITNIQNIIITGTSIE